MSSPSSSKPSLPRVAAELSTWFAGEGRDYPWRRTTDPYAILVSEVMLQQTQIATVLERGFYTRWLERFPSFEILAEADEADVLKAWEGLGYYRRARNLQKLAQVVVNDHGGRFPRDPEVIRSLPGIGPYTAGAVASFAFGLPEPIVDGNVARVLSRLWNDATPMDSTKGQKLLWERAAALVRVAEDPRAFNSAIMELGQTVCRPGVPDCERCPVRGHCTAESPAELPVRKPRPKLTEVTERVFFHQTNEGVLLEKETGSRRTGLWKLPSLPDDESPNAEALPPVLLKTRYGITRYRVTLWVHEAAPGTGGWPESHRLIPHDQLAATAMPSPYRKALDKLLRMDDEFRLE